LERREEEPKEGLVGLAILGFMFWQAYKSGKRTGSYKVGRARDRRSLG
jgi:hypothetical protein